MHKLFLNTYDGDRIRLVFDEPEERTAFESVLEKIRRRVTKNSPRETPIKDFHFDTTLEMEIAEERIDDLRKVIGLETFSIYKNDDVSIIPLPKR